MIDLDAIRARCEALAKADADVRERQAERDVFRGKNMTAAERDESEWRVNAAVTDAMGAAEVAERAIRDESRTDIPALLAEIDRLRGLAARWRAEADAETADEYDPNGRWSGCLRKCADDVDGGSSDA